MHAGMAVGSVVNAIAILRHFAASPEPLGVNGLARTLRISPSSCFNIVKTLAAEDFLAFDPRTKRYALGPAPADLFRDAGFDPIVSAVRGGLDSLAADHAVVGGLWDVRGERSVLRHVVEPEVPTRVHLSVGQRLPRYIGAIGRCLASVDRLDRAEVARIVPGLRWQLPPSVDAYCAEMRRVENHGWSVDEGFFIKGVETVAAPMIDDDGVARYCLTATMFLDQHRADRVARIGGLLAEIAAGAACLPSARAPAGKRDTERTARESNLR